MKPAIHLLDPVANQTGRYQTMRCGLTRHVQKDEFKHTDIPAEVTCIKCRSYINNPWRVLRKYGHVKVVEDMFVMFWGQYGYKFDMAAMNDLYGWWDIVITYQGRLLVKQMVLADNMAELGFRLVDILEKEIMNLKTTTPALKGDFQNMIYKTKAPFRAGGDNQTKL